MDGYTCLKFYIDGQWVPPAGPLEKFPVVNPSDESVLGHIALGSSSDVDRAVLAAQNAFKSFRKTSPEERMQLLDRMIAIYEERIGHIADVIALEMGCPITVSRTVQAPLGSIHMKTTKEALKNLKWSEQLKSGTLVVREPIGVCGLITPWNFPINQVACKVIPAIATGCTVVLKPSEITPLAAVLFAEVLHDAGVPPGVFNLVNGVGPVVGEAISKHPGIDMVSFTGSTRAGVQVAKDAADTVKRVTQELGGKSANIIANDVDVAAAVENGMQRVAWNSGQVCTCPARMLIPANRYDEAVAAAKRTAESIVVGSAIDEKTTMGPLVSETQYDRVQGYIQKGIDEGATLVTGGVGKPEGILGGKGYFPKPTVFANVNNDMTIAREEIFGPVLCIMKYNSIEEAINIANDTEYGLSNSVTASTNERAIAIAKELRSGAVLVNSPDFDFNAPHGGYKRLEIIVSTGHHIK